MKTLCFNGSSKLELTIYKRLEKQIHKIKKIALMETKKNKVQKINF